MSDSESYDLAVFLYKLENGRHADLAAAREPTQNMMHSDAEAILKFLSDRRPSHEGAGEARFNELLIDYLFGASTLIANLEYLEEATGEQHSDEPEDQLMVKKAKADYAKWKAWQETEYEKSKTNVSAPSPDHAGELAKALDTLDERLRQLHIIAYRSTTGSRTTYSDGYHSGLVSAHEAFRNFVAAFNRSQSND